MFGCRHLNSDLRQKPCLVVVICDHQISAYTRLNLYIVSVVTEFCDTPKSQHEYFVRNPVWSAYLQDFVLLGVKCVLNKVCSVYCTSAQSVLYKVAVCIVQGVQCVLYRVCNVYLHS